MCEWFRDEAAGLVQKPLCRSPSAPTLEDLDGHDAFKPQIAGAVNLTHAAGAAEFQDLIRAKPISTVER
jgi:hypothetical protein